MSSITRPSSFRLGLRILAIIGFYAALLAGGAYFGSIIRDMAAAEFGTIHAPTLKIAIIGTALVFAIASALPFVPGAEIGLGMLIMLGGRYALLVYLCMLFALMLAFTVGRLVPLRAITRGFEWFKLHKAHTLITSLAGQPPEERLHQLLNMSSGKFAPLLLRYRFVALIVLVNTPGNSLIGGGGGIALMAGMSGLFKWHHFAIAMALAIAPIPIAFYVAM